MKPTAVGGLVHVTVIAGEVAACRHFQDELPERRRGTHGTALRHTAELNEAATGTVAVPPSLGGLMRRSTSSDRTSPAETERETSARDCSLRSTRPELTLVVLPWRCFIRGSRWGGSHVVRHGDSLRLL